METCMFLCLLVKNLHKNTKHACFHVFSPFSAHLYPAYMLPSISSCVNGVFFSTCIHVQLPTQPRNN